MLFARAEVAILASINAKNGTFFKSDDLLFGPGQAVADLTPVPSTTKNSSVLLRVNDGKPYSGQTRVFYDRLDFAQVMAHTPLNTYAKLRAFRPTTIHELIPALNDYYGLNLTAADIVDGPLTLVNGTGQVVIQANPRSIGWRGEFTVTVAPGDAKLEQWLTDTDLSGIEYPSGQSTKGQAEVYSYRYDASSHWQALRDVEVPADGMLVPQAICDILVEVTGDDWNFNAGDYSLVGAMIKYNGANSSDKQTNPAFMSIMEIELGDACTNFAGKLHIHYNTDSNITANSEVFGFRDNLSSMASYDPRIAMQPDYSLGRINPYLFVGEVDYTPQAAQLVGIPWQASWTSISDANAAKMAAALAAVDGRAWNATAGAEYGLRYAWIGYNGPITNIPAGQLGDLTVEELVRPGFTHVMIAYPPYQQQPNMWYGKMIVHYNP